MRQMSRWVMLFIAVFGMTISAGATHGDSVKVVASFSILADVIRNVGLEQVEVTSLIPVGADPHSYELSAQDLRQLTEADVVFVVGGNFEEGVLQSITASLSEDVPVIEVSACVSIRAFGSHEHEDHADEHDHEHEDENHADDHENHTDEDHADEHDHEHGVEFDYEAICAAHDAYLNDLNTQKAGMLTAGFSPESGETLGRLHELDCADHAHDEMETEDEHDHAEGSCDPHVWMNPYNVYYWTLLIRDSLIALDGEHADVYNANAEEYLYQQIDLVATTLVPLIETIPAERRVLLTNHETLGYFADAYGFDMVGFVLPGGSAFAEPSAQDIAALIDLIRAANVSAVFAETTISASVARQVASEAGVAFYGLYTDSLSAPDGDAPTYLDYLAYNVQTIVTALQGE